MQKARYPRGSRSLGFPGSRTQLDEPYPDSDYELIDGESFVRAWNGVVKAERRFLGLYVRILREAERRERLALVALRAGLDELPQGGAGRFVAAARRWYAVESDFDRRDYDARYDRALDRWNKADERLSEVQDQSFVDYVGERYPRSYLVLGGPSSPDDEQIPEEEPPHEPEPEPYEP